ncbi:MAG: zf-HC2 domain-containing protein [Candidatus Brocadiia bacterium]
MKCPEIKQMLSPYLDNELSRPETEAVESHIKSCSDCRKELTELEQIKGLIKSLPRHNAPKNLLANVVINQPVSTPREKAGLRWKFQWVSTGLASAAAMFFVIYITMTALPRYELIHETSGFDVMSEAGKKPENNDAINTYKDKISGSLKLQESLKKGQEGFIPELTTNLKNKESDKSLDKKNSNEYSRGNQKGMVKSNKSSDMELSKAEAMKPKDMGDMIMSIKPEMGLKEKAMGSPGAPGAPPVFGAGAAPAEKRKYAFSIKVTDSALWNINSMENLLQQALATKQLVMVYFYFSSKDYFPKNRDEKLMEYSTRRAIFTKIFVTIDQSNKITDAWLGEFFSKNKLDHSAQCVILDYYGNMIQSVTKPLATNKITAAIDAADKKIYEIKSDFNTSYTKAEALGNSGKITEQIKILTGLLKKPYTGYPAIEKARIKLDNINQQALSDQKSIIQKYIDVADEDDRDIDMAIKELENLARQYKGLAAEKEIRDSINRVKQTRPSGE